MWLLWNWICARLLLKWWLLISGSGHNHMGENEQKRTQSCYTLTYKQSVLKMDQTWSKRKWSSSHMLRRNSRLEYKTNVSLLQGLLVLIISLKDCTDLHIRNGTTISYRWHHNTTIYLFVFNILRTSTYFMSRIHYTNILKCHVLLFPLKIDLPIL